MYPPRFTYVAPASLEEAVQRLVELGSGARPLAGGQSVIPLMKLRRLRPTHLIDLRALPMSSIEARDGTLRIGALTTHARLERSGLVRDFYPLLSDVARVTADPIVRNLGTIGGAAAFAHPSGDWWPALLAARAELVAIGREGVRTIPVDDFFTGGFETSLGHAEILTEVRIVRPPGSGGAYFKLRRRVGDFAIVGVAVQLGLDPDGSVRECGIAVTGVGLHCIRANKAEEYLTGGPLDPEALARASEIVSEQTHPTSDHRGSADYKREMVRVFAARALAASAARARG